MKPTHAMTFNWNDSMHVDTHLAHGGEKVHLGVESLDGEETWSFAIWPIPDPNFYRAPRATDARACLQAAGSRSALTIALTREEPRNGDTHCQYVLGKAWNGVTPPREVSLEWNGGGTTVFENEVFTADEAAPIFAYYLEHDTVPAEVELRLIDTISY